MSPILVERCFPGEYGPRECNHLGFSELSLILYLVHHIAKLTRSCCRNFSAKHRFKLKAHCAISASNWNSEFYLWCGVGRSLT